LTSLVHAREWRTLPLIEVATLQRGYDLPVQERIEGVHPIFAANGPVGAHVVAKCAGPGVVTGRSGTIGKVHFVADDYWPLNTALYVKDFHGNDPKWVYYMLSTFGLENFAQGAGVPTLNRNLVHGEPVRVPPASEQRRIAAILDQADALRAQRRQALAELDKLAHAVFLEMFGDTLTNSKDWPETHKLGEVAVIASGVTKGRKVGDVPTRAVPYLAVANVQDKALNLAGVKEIEATEAEIKRYRLQRNDLLLTEGGDPDKLGRGTLWNDELPECIHQNHIFRVRLTHPDVLPLFLNWLVGSSRGKAYFLRSAKQTTGIASINMTQLRDFPLLLPPLALQETFATRLQGIESMKASYRTALAESDALFKSLQHLAFTGKL